MERNEVVLFQVLDSRESKAVILMFAADPKQHPSACAQVASLSAAMGTRINRLRHPTRGIELYKIWVTLLFLGLM